MSNDKMREAFEREKRVPDHFYYHQYLNEYLSKTDVEATETLLFCNRAWKLWQSAWQAALQSQQPESDPVGYLYRFSDGVELHFLPDLDRAEDAESIEPVILASASPQPTPQVPEGWHLAPGALTEAMEEAWFAAPRHEGDFNLAYKAMLAAAPSLEK